MSNGGLLLLIAGCGYYYYKRVIKVKQPSSTADPVNPVDPTDPKVPPVVVTPPVVVVPPTLPPVVTPTVKPIPNDIYLFGKRTRAGATPSVGEYVTIGAPMVGSSLVDVRLDNGAVPECKMITLLFENPGSFVYYANRPDGVPSSDGIVSTLYGFTKENWDLTNPISIGSTRSSEFNDATGWFLDTSDNVRPTDILIGKSLSVYGTTTFGADSDSFSRWIISNGQFSASDKTIFQKLPFTCVQAPTRRQFLLIKVPLGRSLVWNG